MSCLCPPLFKFIKSASTSPFVVLHLKEKKNLNSPPKMSPRKRKDAQKHTHKDRYQNEAIVVHAESVLASACSRLSTAVKTLGIRKTHSINRYAKTNVRVISKVLANCSPSDGRYLTGSILALLPTPTILCLEEDAPSICAGALVTGTAICGCVCVVDCRVPSSPVLNTRYFGSDCDALLEAAAE